MRVPGHLARASGAALVFVLAAIGGALLHRNLPTVRRAILTRVNAALATVLPGHIVIQRLGSLGFDRVSGVDVSITDPGSVEVIQLRGLTARIDVVGFLRSLRSTGPLAIDLPEVAAQSADVNLDPAPEGPLRIVRACVPATAAPPSPAARPVRLHMPQIRLGRVTVHGSPASGLPLDIAMGGVDALVRVGPGETVLDLAVADVTARGVPPGATTHGAIRAHLEQPSPRGGERSARVSWQGTVGAIPTTAFAMLEGNAAYAAVDAPSVLPADLTAVWPGSPLLEPASAHVEAVGLLPALFVSASVSCGHGTIRASGPVTPLGDTRLATLAFDATSLDARAASSRTPETSLDAHGTVLLASTAAGAIGAVTAVSVTGKVGPAVLPPTAIDADFARDAPPSAQVRARAHLVVREPGAPSTIDATVRPQGTGLAVAFDANVVVPDLDHVLRLGPIARGSARLSARGQFDTTSEKLDGTVSGSARGVQAGPLSVARLSMDARATGSLTAPRLDGDLHGEDLDISGLRVAHLHAGIHGPASAAEVSVHLGGPDAHLRAKATVGAVAGTTSVRDLRVEAEHGSETARLEAARITFSAGELRVDDAELRGFGAPLHVTARGTPGTFTLQTHSRSIELTRVARFAGITTIPAGRVALDLDTTLHRTDGEGHLVVDVTGATLGALGDSEAHLDVALSGRQLSAKASARLADVGTFQAQSSALDIGGKEPLGLDSWRTIGGTVDAEAHVDLARLASQLPAAALPISKLGGSLDLRGQLTRAAAADAYPDIELSAGTTGLVTAGPASAPWATKGVEVEADLTVDGQTQRTTLEAKATDAHGVLVVATLGADHLPYARLASRQQPLLSVLRTLPFAATVSIPGRELAELPAFLGTRGIHGQLDGTLAWGGTLDGPAVDLNATLEHGSAPARVLSVPFDLALTGHYDGQQVDAELVASTRAKKLLDATAQVQARAADLLQLGAQRMALPWKASAHVQLTQFPLSSIAALDDRQVRGRLSGDLSVQGLHDDASATFDLSSTDLTVGELPCKNAAVKASLDGKALDLRVRVDEADGSLQASAHAGTHWGAALTPLPDVGQTVDLTLAAKTFRVLLIQPFVEDVFSELDGRVDADVRVHADPVKHLFQPQGSIKLADGVVQVASVGGEFHGTTAEIDLTPDGVVRLQKASALGLSGKVEAAASARFDGLAFAGARGTVQVPRQQPLPLVFDGVQVGTFDGQLGVDVDPVAAAKGGGYDVKVDVQQMQLQLADEATRAVQKLGPLDGVTVGMKRPGGDFVPTRLDGPTQAAEKVNRASSPLRVTVALGSNVVVKRGTTLQVYLGGTPSITVSDDVHASGQVRLLHGTLDVQGKTFTIENGTVTFVDDPTNPQVVLTASWPAPDGTTIYADFIGPLKTGKVTLRADPARPQNEILSLILFGTTDEQAPTSGGSTAQQSSAVGAAGGAATAPINQALGGVNQMLDNFGLAGGISTRVDTSQATPRPEVEIQIARDLSIQVAWVLGVPPPGSNPDSTLFTLDWRFLRSWTLETTVGDAGTSILDLLWQDRY